MEKKEFIASKEEEFKALEQIKKIVKGLGENSYIGSAFEGCFEIAENNIVNDFGCSMKQRAEKAEKDSKYFQEESNKYSSQCAKALEENNKLKEELEKAKSNQIDKNLYNDLYNIVYNQSNIAKEDIMIAANQIAKFNEGSDTRQKAIDKMKVLFERKELLDKILEKLGKIVPTDIR